MLTQAVAWCSLWRVLVLLINTGSLLPGQDIVTKDMKGLNAGNLCQTICTGLLHVEMQRPRRVN